MYKTSLAVGSVWHQRYAPKVHEFSYQLNSFLIDIDDIESIATLSNFISVEKFNLYYFNNANYLRGDHAPLKLKVRKKFSQLGATLDGQERIFMLGQLSNLGAYFSPLNLFLCFRANQCCYVLAEVANTPWNQRHYYLIDLVNQAYIVKKDFHVSPFWGLNQDYHWKFNFTNQQIYFQIDNYQAGEKVFSAGYSANLLAAEHNAKLDGMLIKNPWNIYKILLAIYYQALKLFIKKIPFVANTHNKSNKE